MAELNPIQIYGPWKSGWALDKHVVRSIFVGNNEFGHPVFDTERSYIGQLLYELKYKQDGKKVRDIVSLATEFMKTSWKIDRIINLIAPIPPSNVYRSFQPVYEICRRMGSRLGIRVDLDALKKIDRLQAKDMGDEKKREQIKKSMALDISSTIPLHVLIVDDLYDTGATLTVAAELLQASSSVAGIYALTMTKTKG